MPRKSSEASHGTVCTKPCRNPQNTVRIVRTWKITAGAGESAALKSVSDAAGTFLVQVENGVGR